jgi:hypothetical protein
MFRRVQPLLFSLFHEVDLPPLNNASLKALRQIVLATALVQRHVLTRVVVLFRVFGRLLAYGGV